MGSPSLLNGDFLENVGRLKDFSWSITYAKFKENRPAHTREISFVDSLPFIGIPFLMSACLGIAMLIVSRLIRNKRLTRAALVSVYFLQFVVIELFCALLIYLATDNKVSIYIIISLVYIVMPVFMAFVFKSQDLQPITKRKFHCCGPLELVFMVSAVLIFLFFPALATESLECPEEYDRFIHEWNLLIAVLSHSSALLSFKMMLICSETEEFEIYEGYTNKRVGKLVKKEGFGWIEQYEEGKGPKEGSSNKRSSTDSIGSEMIVLNI
ncbi:hypothetical protein CAEBREN_03683 [Caenorhabditis brenneri]|uniref:Uncharacterized protein n=1 Tax=Caenorhabditis brenneri TaxID=135651 RepID=G0ME23_CAEBE|nr:hypothetical protein CAEBREN_03683 [Caenorhabditis brenneri]